MAVRSFRDMNPYVIGVASVGLIAVFVGLAFAVGILHLGEDKYTVTAIFKDSAGMRTGDDVRVAGVKVGRVGGVSANRREGNVRIKLIIKDGVELGPETTAEIALETLLGTKYVRLTGPVRPPFLEDTKSPVIPVERTKLPFDVFELAKAGTEAIEQTDTERLNLLVDQLATVTEGRREDIAKLVTGLEQVSGSINEREGALSTLLERVETISATLDEKDRVLIRLLDQSQNVLDVLEANREQFARGLRGADTLTAQLAQLTSQFKGTLDQLLGTVHKTADIL
ncbi:MAG TPA: MCE family protein, partial [Acidimicrobiia bacterium]|nr:MCE family protein [Acidimicrobiia bacterium]